MARRRIRLGNEGRRGPWPEVEERRGWWNRKPPPRGSLVPRSTISRQHNSSPLVHSPQPSGTAETSTLILLVGSLFPASLSSPDRSLSLSLSLSPYSHPSLSSSPSPESARPPLLSSSCPNFIPGSPFTRARQASSSYTSASRPLCFNNTVYIGTRSIDLFARRPLRVRRVPRWTYRTYRREEGENL